MRVLRLPVIAGLALAAVLVAVAPALSGSKSGQGKTYLFAVAVCPPYREEFPPSVCKAAVKAVVDNFSDALAIAEEDIVTLTDEKSTGTGFLAALADLGKRLTSADRLILYLNAHGDTFRLWSGHYGVSRSDRRDQRPHRPRRLCPRLLDQGRAQGSRAGVGAEGLADGRRGC
jgi:hypothetical protein